MKVDRNEEIERLKSLRSDLCALQEKYVIDLCGEDINQEETLMQSIFGSLIWELDERIRAVGL